MCLASPCMRGVDNRSLCPISYIAETIKLAVNVRVIDIIKFYENAVKDKPQSSSPILCALETITGV